MKFPKFFHFASRSSLAVLAFLALSACAHKKESTKYPGLEGDYVTGTPLPERIEGSNFFGSTVTRNKFPAVYFDFDSFAVSDTSVPTVDRVANAMQKNSHTVIIAGFTDERGTEEYNRGLGERRAQSVRETLMSMGIPASRIQTVSFGEEMPANPNHTDAAYAANRRAEFGILK